MAKRIKRTWKTPKEKKIASIIKSIETQENLGFVFDAKLKTTDYWKKNYTLKELRKVNKNTVRAKATGYETEDVILSFKEDKTLKQDIIERFRQAEKGVKRKSLLEAKRYIAKSNIESDYGNRSHLYDYYDEEDYDYIYQADIVLRNIEEILSNYAPDSRWNSDMFNAKANVYNTAISELEQAIEREGRTAVARRLEEHPELPNTLNSALYGYGKNRESSGDLTLFVSIVRGSAQTPDEVNEIMGNDDYSDFEEDYYE